MIQNTLLLQALSTYDFFKTSQILINISQFFFVFACFCWFVFFEYCHLTFELYFWKFDCFWHHDIFINSNKCFSILFVAIFCNYSQALSMHHSDSDSDSKLYYQKAAYKRDFIFFVVSILLESRIIPQFWCWCKKIVQIYMWLFDV